MVEVVLYSKDGCIWCNRAKRFLSVLPKEMVVNYREINLSNVTAEQYEIEKTKLIENTAQKTFPYIFIDGKFIGGFNELKKKLNNEYEENSLDF